MSPSSLIRGCTPEEPPAQPEPPNQAVVDVLRRIVTIVERFNIDLADQFSSYQLGPGFVRSSVFKSVLYNLPNRLRQNEIDILSDHYTDQQSKFVDKNRFLADLVKLGVKQTKSPIGDDVHKVWRQLKAHFDLKQIIPFQLFKSSDRFGAASGLLHKQKLHEILMRTGIQLTEADEDVLTKAFEAQEMPEQINYRKLAEAIDRETSTPDDLAAARVPPSVSNSGEY